MSPLDDELRHVLNDRADRLRPAADPLAGIEQRARQLRRNRLVSVAAAVALLAGGAAVAVPTLLSSSGGGDSAPSERLTQVPEPTPSPSPTALPAGDLPFFSAAGRLDPAQPWAYRGVALPPAQRSAFAQELQVRYPGSTFVPLFGQVIEYSQVLEVVFLARATGQGDLWGVVQDTADGPDVPWVRPLPSGASGLAAALPGDSEGDPTYLGRALVVTAPSADRITYIARPGAASVDELAELAPGVGTLGMAGDPGTDRVAAYAGSTRLFEDLAPDLPAQVAEPTSSRATSAPPSPTTPPATTAPTTTPARPATPPSNAVTWPLRGSLANGPDLDAAKRAFALGLGGTTAELTFRPLLALDFDGGLRLVAGQAWLAGGKAHGVAYAVGGTCPASTFIGRPTPERAGVLAFAPDCVPGRTVDTVLVVPQPRTGQVSYGVPGSEYRDVEFLPGLEPVVELERAPEAERGTDLLRVLDGNGDLDKPVYEGPLQALLCGIKECG